MKEIEEIKILKELANIIDENFNEVLPYEILRNNLLNDLLEYIINLKK